jgi:hypothetical protein
MILPRNLPLVDEIDLRQCFLFDKIPSAASMQGMVIGKEELNVICGRATQSFDDAATHCSRHGGNTSNNVSPNQSPVRRRGGEFKACPCCRRYIENLDHLVSPGSVGTSSTMEQQQQQQKRQQRGASSPQKSNNSSDNMDVETDDNEEEYGSWNLQRSMLTSTMGSSLMSLINGGLEDLNHQEEDEEEFNMAAATLVQGDKVQQYTITETIVQGWLYKKGSGNDIWGRRWWKPRWVTLAVSSMNMLIITHKIFTHARAHTSNKLSILPSTYKPSTAGSNSRPNSTHATPHLTSCARSTLPRTRDGTQ